MATHSSILARIIPWTEEPGRLRSMGSQRVGRDWVTKHGTDLKWKSGFSVFLLKSADLVTLNSPSCLAETGRSLVGLPHLDRVCTRELDRSPTTPQDRFVPCLYVSRPASAALWVKNLTQTLLSACSSSSLPSFLCMKWHLGAKHWCEYWGSKGRQGKYAGHWLVWS